LPNHDVFVGEVVAAYCDQECMTDGAPDWAKLQPILFSMLDKGYWRLGERFARAWSVGKSYGQSSDA
jgi:flavin reductase (DIM6/NTAB) family NADH-FMN oxidoreductase RutF